MDFREPTAQEVETWERFRRGVIGSRIQIQAALTAGGVAGSCQIWAAQNAIALPVPVFTPVDEATLKLIAARATKMESYVAGLETQKLAFRIFTLGGRRDLDVIAPMSGSLPEAYPWEQYQGLGLIPLIIIVAGIVLVAGAIALDDYLITDAKNKETEYKKRVIELDKWAAGQGGQVASSWRGFKEQNKSLTPENKSFWDSLGIGKIGEMLGPLLIGGLALWALATFGGSSARSAVREEEPIENPRGPMRVQSLLFDRRRWTPTAAAEWAYAHGYRLGRIEGSDAYWRMRQFSPRRAHTFRTIRFGRGISAVVAK